MTTVERIELFHVAVPLAAPFYPSWIPGCPQTESRFTLLKMTTKDGVEGFAAGNAFFCGGLETVRKISRACLEQGLEFTPHTWTNGIGLIVNLYAFAAFPERRLLEYPFEPPGWVPEGRDAILEEPIGVSSEGTINVPQEPGLGLKIGPKRLRRFGRRFYRTTTVRLAVNTIRKKGLRTALELKKKKQARVESVD